MQEIRIVAEMRLLPGAKKELEAAFAKLIDQSRAEDGNISYDLTEDIADPDHLFMLETWASEAAIREHDNTPHFLEFKKLSAGKMSENRVTLLKPVQV